MMASHQQWESDDADDDHYRYDTDNESEDFQTHQIVQKDKCVQFVLFSENLQNKQVNKQIRAYIYPYAHRSIHPKTKIPFGSVLSDHLFGSSQTPRFDLVCIASNKRSSETEQTRFFPPVGFFHLTVQLFLI